MILVILGERLAILNRDYAQALTSYCEVFVDTVSSEAVPNFLATLAAQKISGQSVPECVKVLKNPFADRLKETTNVINRILWLQRLQKLIFPFRYPTWLQSFSVYL